MNEGRPEFFKTWQAMALASSTMLQSNMLSALYALQASEYFFNDEDLVRQAVLVDFSTNQQNAIYEDSFYGLNSTVKL